MAYSKEICKVTDNQLVFPVDYTENIGNSLSSINYNFNVLDVYTCNFEFSAENIWNQTYNVFAANSAQWNNAITTIQSNSACWNDTYNTVSTLSSVWLKPISLIYPYPFDESDDVNIASISTDVQNWLNENMPVKSGTCFNFIQGQELYVFTPQYGKINQIISQRQTIGVKTVRIKFIVGCIGKGKRLYRPKASIDCGSSELNIAVPDQYIQKFAGLRFIIDGDTSTWQYDSVLFD